MLQPENQPKKYQTLFADIDTGRTKIPMFQRDFVWSDEQTARLIVSIGFPIGAFIFWQTRDELRHIRKIENIAFPDTSKGDSRQYVLDGPIISRALISSRQRGDTWSTLLSLQQPAHLRPPFSNRRHGD
jgi:Protein of unknown function DUF262